jgi:hypothetical protein
MADEGWFQGLEVVVFLGAVLTAIAIIVKSGKVVALIFRKFNHIYDDYFGEPARPGHKATQGLAERVQAIEDALATGNGKPIGQKVDYIEHEVREAKAIGHTNSMRLEQVGKMLKTQEKERHQIMKAVSEDRRRWQEAIGVEVDPPEAWKGYFEQVEENERGKEDG